MLWSVDGGDYSNAQSSYSCHEHFEVTLNSVGTYVFTAYTEGDQCYRSEKTFTLGFIPDFSIVQQCNAIVIQNNSQFLDGTKTFTIRFNGNNYTFPLSNETYTIPNVAPGIYTLCRRQWTLHRRFLRAAPGKLPPNARNTLRSPHHIKTVEKIADSGKRREGNQWFDSASYRCTRSLTSLGMTALAAALRE